MARHGVPFRKGHKHAIGGVRPGAGRPTNEFKRGMQKIADSPKFYAWLRGIVEGDIAVDADTRLKAWKEARDSGYGKPTENVDMVVTKSPQEIEADSKRFERLDRYLGELIK